MLIKLSLPHVLVVGWVVVGQAFATFSQSCGMVTEPSCAGGAASSCAVRGSVLPEAFWHRDRGVRLS